MFNVGEMGHGVKLQELLHTIIYVIIDPVYTDPCGHDIEFGQFTVIFTLATFSIISF